jgi:DNA invertase Pin-like site-specific DNA recombinase
MNESTKVQPRHLERGAYLYIRQSSMRQVIENVESTKRQYALRGRAIALGWRDDQITVIDNDQGESGASASWREGFQRLVTEVGIGHAGIVMGLEVSRLARNNADWHRLLEICALADTLILDEDGVYDPTSFNDRLLLGLKGTMSEAELHVLKARLRGGILNKARRGEYHCPLPTGFVYERLETWYVCDRAHGSRGEPNCQSIAGWPIDEAVGALINEKMTPAAIELALEIRREIEARYEEADRLRHRAVERARIEADLAQRRFMLVDPTNRLVADTLEHEWNDKLRTLAKAQEERERGRQEDLLVLNEEIQRRLVAMTTDFKTLWLDPGTPNRDRKRLLACVIEDATLVKFPEDGTTKIHVRFKGGKTETLTTLNPKSSAQQVKTQPSIVSLVDKLLDDHTYSEISDLLMSVGSAPAGRHDADRPVRALPLYVSPTWSTVMGFAHATSDFEIGEC